MKNKFVYFNEYLMYRFRIFFHRYSAWKYSEIHELFSKNKGMRAQATENSRLTQKTRRNSSIAPSGALETHAAYSGSQYWHVKFA
jgi:hypothetical protein